ncbi:hypothetical protein KUTeg_001544 [Tegillarca granosa]|uniref:Uncharacterized protein n=1 Tax=Tegillarca granosa TaxID=220873 RepID=A0ABQ9FRR1_TEGGR|nr:hypothetical protein KUTeg_001544 [Tegillarca granosa]
MSSKLRFTFDCDSSEELEAIFVTSRLKPSLLTIQCYIIIQKDCFNEIINSDVHRFYVDKFVRSGKAAAVEIISGKQSGTIDPEIISDIESLDLKCAHFKKLFTFTEKH